MEYKIKDFKKSHGDLYGFNFCYEDEIPADTSVMLKVPPVTANKRSVNDIGWMVQCDDADANSVFVKGTLSSNVNEDSIWQDLIPGEDVNKTISGIMITNNGSSPCKAVIRAILC